MRPRGSRPTAGASRACVGRTAAAHYALSPHGAETLAADARAFSRLMAHLRERDPQHTVIMVQVENEAGSYELARDHAPEPARLFAEPIPRTSPASSAWPRASGPKPSARAPSSSS
jgi:hypothetical protein